MRHLYRWILIASFAGMPIAASAQQAFAIRNTEVFAGPSSEFPPVAVLLPNANVRIAGCLADWSWCDVIFSNYRGWVYAADLVVPYESRRVRVVEYGPQLGFAVVTFSLNSYWDRHYRGRPWYREREQWARRVRIEGDHGGTPPQRRSAQTERRQPQQGERAPHAGPPAERSSRMPESGRSAPGAGGTPPATAAVPRPQQEGKPRPDHGGGSDRSARPPHEQSSPKAGAGPDSPKSAPGAGGKPPEKGQRSGAQKNHDGRDGASGGGDRSHGKKDRDRD